MALAIVAGVAAVAVVSIMVASLAFARTTRGMQRQHARERELLLNQICNLSGKPWLPAPADEPGPELEPARVLVAAPEQLAEL